MKGTYRFDADAARKAVTENGYACTLRDVGGGMRRGEIFVVEGRMIRGETFVVDSCDVFGVCSVTFEDGEKGQITGELIKSSAIPVSAKE